MKFEEQFPELKMKLLIDVASGEYARSHSYDDIDDRKLIVEDVKEHCLSKQKVLEAIDNMKILCSPGCFTSDKEATKDALKKELGLKDD